MDHIAKIPSLFTHICENALLVVKFFVSVLKLFKFLQPLVELLFDLFTLILALLLPLQYFHQPLQFYLMLLYLCLNSVKLILLSKGLFKFVGHFRVHRLVFL